MGDGVISVKGVSVSYDSKPVLRNISLELGKGVLCGIIGPNGAGKSTLFKAILGLLESQSGEVLIKGEPVEAHRKDMAYVPQKDGVNWRFPATVEDVVLMGRYPYKKLFQSFGKKDRQLVAKALEDVGMTEYRHRQIGELSGGQQQRVFLARVLCQGADILLLDEPFVGVDIKTEERIISLLKRLAMEGCTILVIHHDLSKVREYFDQVILLNGGLVAYGNVEMTFNLENVNRTYGGQLPVL